MCVCVCVCVCVWLRRSLLVFGSRFSLHSSTQMAVAFVTRQYMTKVMDQTDKDICAREFRAVQACKKPLQLVVMEPEMRDTKTWTGLLILYGSSLYEDLTADDRAANVAAAVLKKINPNAEVPQGSGNRQQQQQQRQQAR
jgi:hypothetical protein